MHISLAANLSVCPLLWPGSIRATSSSSLSMAKRKFPCLHAGEGKKRRNVTLLYLMVCTSGNSLSRRPDQQTKPAHISSPSLLVTPLGPYQKHHVWKYEQVSIQRSGRIKLATYRTMRSIHSTSTSKTPQTQSKIQLSSIGVSSIHFLVSQLSFSPTFSAAHLPIQSH